MPPVRRQRRIAGLRRLDKALVKAATKALHELKLTISKSVPVRLETVSTTSRRAASLKDLPIRELEKTNQNQTVSDFQNFAYGLIAHMP